MMKFTLVLCVLFSILGCVYASDNGECSTWFGDIHTGDVTDTQIKKIVDQGAAEVISKMAKAADMPEDEVSALFIGTLKTVRELGKSETLRVLRQLVKQSKPFAALSFEHVAQVSLIRCALFIIHVIISCVILGKDRRGHLMVCGNPFWYNAGIPVLTVALELFFFWLFGSWKAGSSIASGVCIVVSHLSMCGGFFSARSCADAFNKERAADTRSQKTDEKIDRVASNFEKFQQMFIARETPAITPDAPRIHLPAATAPIIHYGSVDSVQQPGATPEADTDDDDTIILTPQKVEEMAREAAYRKAVQERRERIAASLRLSNA